MTERRQIQEAVIFMVPETVDASDPAIRRMLPTLLARKSYDAVWGQYEHRGNLRPADIEFPIVDWLVTDEPRQVREFEIEHDCDECREGTRRAVEFLEQNPGRYVAVANMSYVEVWPDGVN